MAKYGALTFVLIFIGLFVLLAVVVTGLATQDQNNTTNLTDTQDVQSEQKSQTQDLQNQAIWGMSKLQIGLIILGVLIAIGVFLKVLMGKRSF
jgi:Na+/proline symporter